MKVSIITVVYNRMQTVYQSIDSVLNQSYRNLELVVQDGGSTDGTQEILNSIDDSRMVVESGQDDGIYDALNKALKRSSGDVIGLMHSDDFYSNSEVINNVVQYFRDPAIDGVYGDLEYVSRRYPDRIVRRWKAGQYNKSKLRWGWMPPHPTVFVRREFIDQWGAYNTRYRISADYDALLRWLLKGKLCLAYHPHVLVKMRVGGESNNGIRRLVVKMLEDYEVIRSHNIGGVLTLCSKNITKIHQFVK